MSKLIVFLILVLIIFPKPAYSATTPVFSTYLGGVNEDYIRDVAIDSQGNIYITGGTDSDNFPTTQGAYDRTYGTGVACAVIGGAGVMDVFVTKLTPSGQIIWSTYLGGPCYDRAYGIEVDSQGYVYLTGRAGRGFPTTSGTFQPAFNGYNQGAYGEENAFVAKISPDGSQLVWASYFGTNDGNRDLALDQNGDIFVASYGRVGAPYNSSWFTLPIKIL